MIRNRILTFVTLVKRKINVVSSLCPLCRSNEESLDHIFFSCCVASKVWCWLVEWSATIQNALTFCIDLMDMLKPKGLIEECTI